MKSKSILIALAILPFLLFGQPPQAQDMGNAGYKKNLATNHPRLTDPPRAQDPSINQQFFNIKINALYNRKADAQLAIFNLVQMGKTAAEADTILYNRITRFMEGSIRLGVSRDDIYVDMISQVPIYEYEVEKKRFSKNYTEVPRGIEVQRNLHVRFTDSRILERLVSLAAQNQIYDLVKVEYFVENPQAIYDSLRQEAIKLLNKTIKDYKALGVDLSESYRMFSERDAITKVYKPKTFYYNKLSESNFDIVMHASIIEPVIQYTYSIHIRLDTPQRPVKEAKPTPPKPQIITKTQTIKESEFFLVTPDGKVQTLLKTQSDR
jgi:uncharacterized protein YggE